MIGSLLSINRCSPLFIQQLLVLREVNNLPRRWKHSTRRTGVGAISPYHCQCSFTIGDVCCNIRGKDFVYFKLSITVVSVQARWDIYHRKGFFGKQVHFKLVEMMQIPM